MRVGLGGDDARLVVEYAWVGVWRGHGYRGHGYVVRYVGRKSRLERHTAAVFLKSYS